MKKYFCLLCGLFLAIILSGSVFATPPGWAKSGKRGVMEQITEKPIKVQNETAGSTTQSKQAIATNATPPAPETRRIDWGAISVAIGLIGAFIGWYLSRKTRSKSAAYLKEIDAIYKKSKTKPEKLDEALRQVHHSIQSDFEKGKLTDQSLALLDARIEKYEKEARISTISNTFTLPKNIKKQIGHMLDDGIITEEEYDQFIDMDLTKLSQKEYERLTKLMRKWKEMK